MLVADPCDALERPRTVQAGDRRRWALDNAFGRVDDDYRRSPGGGRQPWIRRADTPTARRRRA